MWTSRLSPALVSTSLLACAVGAACAGQPVDERTSPNETGTDGVSMTEPTGTGGGTKVPPAQPGPTGGGASGSPDGGASDSGGSAKGDAGAEDAGGTPSPFDAFQQKNLDEINAYRATKGIAPLVLDEKLSAFALEGSKQLSVDHIPHKHFQTASDNGTIWQAGFKGSGGENQGDPNGWHQMAADPKTNEMLQIAAIQKAMFDEGPGPGQAHGHYMTMMDAKYKRVGVGLLMVGVKLYLTNDYSE